MSSSSLIFYHRTRCPQCHLDTFLVHKYILLMALPMLNFPPVAAHICNSPVPFIDQSDHLSMKFFVQKTLELCQARHLL